MTALHHAAGVGLVAVVENAVVVDVRQRIEVGMRHAMRYDSHAVGADRDHVVFERIGVVDRLFGVGNSRERDGDPLLHESRSLTPLGRRDQVERAQLIIVAPASPVRMFLLPPLEVGARDLLRGSGCTR